MEKVTINLSNGGYIEFEKELIGVRVTASTFKKSTGIIVGNKIGEILKLNSFEKQKLHDLEFEYNRRLNEERRKMEHIITGALAILRMANEEEKERIKQKAQEQLEGIYFDEQSSYELWKRKRDIMNTLWVEI